MVENHTHSGTDSPKLRAGEAIEMLPLEAVNDVNFTAGATYTSNEQGMLNGCRQAINELLVQLRNANIIKE